jgi:CRISPR/Cas system-associated exonuclease Cas4 (RecB family)
MIDLIAAVDAAKQKRIVIWPIRTNRASNMGDPCLRRLVYERTAWQSKKLHDLGLQYIFDLGREQEEAVLRDLSEAGIRVVEQQRPFDWERYQISGHIDGRVVSNGNSIPIEIKGFSPWNWGAINSVADMLHSKAVYMQKYPAQMTLYLLMDNKEEGAFLLRNKTTGRLKQIPITLDYEYGEALIKQAEAINKHIAEDTLPDHAENQALCDDCSFDHICLPEINREASLVLDPELEGMLDRRGELKASVSEYEELDKEIKKTLAARPETIVGNWLCRGKWVERKGYSVQDSHYWQTSIKRMP